MKKILDGNKAVAEVAYLFSEVASIYPITPSSPMASRVDEMASEHAYNLYHDQVKLVEMQSEAGAAGAMHGALLTGSLATTFTASQGLLLMIPNMYKMAGEMLPGVIHVASRTIATHALSIFGDHSDVYATRSTGFCMLSSSSVQSAYHMASVAHLAAMKCSLPFLHFFDGFRTSHELSTIEVLSNEDLLKLVPWESVKEFKRRSLNVGSSIQRGMAENEDIFFQSMEAKNGDYEKVCDVVRSYMDEINRLSHTNYAPFMYYGSPDATDVIVAMGSVCDTIRLVIQEEQKKGRKIGLVEVLLYRPFSSKYLLDVLPKTVEKIAVLDRTKEHGSVGEPLYLDVCATLKDSSIQVVGGRYGLSSKNTTPAQIKSVYDMLESSPKNDFTIGILDDVTHTSLEVDESYKIPLNALEVKIFGFGSDGMVSASKDLLHILGDHEGKYVEGYFEYDSKKSGGVTVSHLRISQEEIRAPFYVTNPDVVVVTKPEYFDKFSLLTDIKDEAVLLVNTDDEVSLCERFTHQDLEIIKSKKIRLLCIDASKLALEHQLNGKISKIMEVIILSHLGVKNAVSLVGDSIQKEFRTKGEEVVQHNLDAISDASRYVKQVFLTNQTGKENLKPVTIFDMIEHRMGGELPVSKLQEIKDGTFPGGLSKLEKRNVSSRVVKWNREHCIQCGMCSFVCPHAVIRPFLVDEDVGPMAVGTNKHYLISVSEADCTGCGLCAFVCPGKDGVKALSFGSFDEQKQKEADYYFEEYENPEVEPLYTIKNSQFRKPRFEFSGACAGCGETAYIKLLTQLYQDQLVLSNATGCSSIYGGSAPSTVYTVPWANSLFEDNAEFAYGMHLSFEKGRHRILEVMEASKDAVDEKVRKLYTEFQENFHDFKITSRIQKDLESLTIPKELQELLCYVPARTVWAIGGDGWAYDIGFGGIDHVLSSNENIKILVLDTEVYSNTGGQMSKSSHVGQVAEFADAGKQSRKKDLFRIAMSYPNCYVASICLGANMMHTLKVFKEAQEHVGPSIVIAYATCIEHGIKGGMSCSLSEQKRAVDVGYCLLMRYNPLEKRLYLDSKEPDFSHYEEFLENEVRYRALKIKNPSFASKLLLINQENAKERYQYYLELSKKN